jgi:hypothetical protein
MEQELQLLTESDSQLLPSSVSRSDSLCHLLGLPPNQLLVSGNSIYFVMNLIVV